MGSGTVEDNAGGAEVAGEVIGGVGGDGDELNGGGAGSSNGGGLGSNTDGGGFVAGEYAGEYGADMIFVIFFFLKN